MLKFTKYGRTPSTGSFAGKEKPAVVLTAFTEMTEAAPEETQQEEGQKHTTKFVSRGSLSANKTSVSQLLPAASKTYLIRSKLSKSELMQLEMEDEVTKSVKQQNAKQVLYSKPPLIMKCHNLEEVDGEKKRCKKSASNSFRSMSPIKLPVYNDGYFPKVRPLNKLLTMKRSGSDSGLMMGERVRMNKC